MTEDEWKIVELDDKLKYVTYTSYWTSFKQLKKHLIANNENISLN